jgi:alpha-N-arabinofuranosidase
MGRLRAQNGHPQPYAIKYWSIGNEEYLPTLGATDGRQYGRNFNLYAKKMRAVDPSIKLVAVGASDIPAGAIPKDHPLWKIVRYMPDWNAQVLKEAGWLIDYYSLHYYAPEEVQGHSGEEVNQATLAIAEGLKRKVDTLWKQMEQFAPGGVKYPIALDEWSLKVDKETTPPPLPVTNVELAQLGLHMAAASLRQALAEATIFNLMHRYPGAFVLGSRSLLYAYLVGLITIRRDRAIASPVALMMEQYATHDRCQSLETQVQSDTFTTKAMNPGFPEVKDARYLDVSSRLHSDRRTVDVFVVNRNLSQSINCTIRFEGASVASNVEVETLTAQDLNATNTFAEPDRVVLNRQSAVVTDGSISYTFPPHALVKFVIHRK